MPEQHSRRNGVPYKAFRSYLFCPNKSAALAALFAFVHNELFQQVELALAKAGV
jgi:hypothetical protein